MFKTIKYTPKHKKYVNNLLKIVIENDGIILLGEENGEIFGCIVGIIDKIPLGETLGHKKKYKGARVIELYVKPEARGKKVGFFLMKEIEKYFVGKKCDQIRVEVYAPNENAYHFYQKNGYKNESIDLIKMI